MRVGDSWTAHLPEVMTELLDKGSRSDFDDFMKAGLKEGSAELAELRWRMAPYGTDSFYDAYVAAGEMHLEPATLGADHLPAAHHLA